MLGPAILHFHDDRSLYRQSKIMRLQAKGHAGEQLDFDASLGFPGEGPLCRCFSVLSSNSFPLLRPIMPFQAYARCFAMGFHHASLDFCCFVAGAGSGCSPFLGAVDFRRWFCLL